MISQALLSGIDRLVNDTKENNDEEIAGEFISYNNYD